MKYYIIAGEASGDLHGSNLIKGIKEVDSSADIRCWGGDLMQRAGGTLVKHYKDSAVMGFVEVLGNLKKISCNFTLCEKDILDNKPDLLILIDYPGFNLRMAKFAKAHNIPVFYYIAPKVWAWKESRIKLLKKYLDRLFIIFPFEIEYFKRHGIDAIYNGNPLVDSIQAYKNEIAEKGSGFREAFFRNNNLLPDKKLVALLSGSRRNEISYLLPRMLDAIRLFCSDPDNHGEQVQFALACAPAIDYSYYEEIIGKNIEKKGELPYGSFTIVKDATYSVLSYADAAVISSGTASLETALFKIPQVVGYGGNEISYQIAKHLVKLNYISLANLILDKHIFKELIQHQCTPRNIAGELKELLWNERLRDNMTADYNKVIEMLGGGGTSARVAKSMINEFNSLNNNNKHK